MTVGRRLALVGLVAWLLCASVAIGQTADPGFYAGLRAGSASFETPTVRDREGPGLLGYDRRDFTWSVFGGHEWRITGPLAVGLEVGYVDNGAATVTYASGNAYAFRSTQVDVLASVAVVSQRLAFAVKAGVGRTRETYRISTYVGGTPDLDSERTRDLPVVALSAGYAATPRITLFLDVRRTFGDVADTVTKALVNSNPEPPPYRDVLDSVSRVTAISAGLRVNLF